MPPPLLNHTAPTRTSTHGTGILASTALPPNVPILRLTSPYIIIPERSALDSVCSYCFLSKAESPAPVTLRRCTGCKVVRYCSSRCQGRDWKEGGHRGVCGGLRKFGEGGGVLTTAVRAAVGVLVKEGGEKVGGEGGEMGTDKPRWMGLEGHQEELMRGLRASEILLQAKVVCESVEGWQRRVEEVVGLLCRISTNAFRVTNFSSDPVGLLFDPLLALANHSCTPNAVVEFDGRTVTLRSLNTIEKDEQIFVSYIDPTQNKNARRKELKERWFFDCECDRCSTDDSTYKSFLKAKIEEKGRTSELIDFKGIEKHAEESAKLMESNPNIQQALRTLSANTPEITSLIARSDSALEPSTRYSLLRSAVSLTSPFLSDTIALTNLTALPPLPPLLHSIYLNFLSLELYTPALILLLHLAIHNDIYNYPQPHHPVRILRLFTVARLMKVVAETAGTQGLDCLVKECGGVVPREVLGDVDWVSAVQVLLELVRDGLGGDKGQGRFRQIVEVEINEVEAVQRMRGGAGDRIRVWGRVGGEDVEGTAYARKVFEGLSKLAEFAVPLNGKLVVSQGS